MSKIGLLIRKLRGFVDIYLIIYSRLYTGTLSTHQGQMFLNTKPDSILGKIRQRMLKNDSYVTIDELIRLISRRSEQIAIYQIDRIVAAYFKEKCHFKMAFKSQQIDSAG